MYRYFEELPQSGWHSAAGISVESTVQMQPDWPGHESHTTSIYDCAYRNCIAPSQHSDVIHTFQHDGAIAATVNNSVATLCNIFWEHIISHPLWPDHWSNVMPDHFLWGSLEYMQEQFTCTAPTVYKQELQKRVFSNLLISCQACQSGRRLISSTPTEPCGVFP